MSPLPASRNLPLFTYGTLLDETFTRRLLERAVESEAARLLDSELLQLEGLDYPTVFDAPGEAVEGRIYRDIAPRDWERLDAYEGVGEGLYRRIEARVVAGGAGKKGPSEPAFVYVVTEETLRRYGAL